MEMGIKETKEALIGVNELSLVLIKHLKDGAQLTDIMAVVDDLKNNPELLEKLKAAKEGIEQVPAEAKDISLIEAGELLMTQVGYVPKIIAALKADVAPAAV